MRLDAVEHEPPALVRLGGRGRGHGPGVRVKGQGQWSGSGSGSVVRVNVSGSGQAQWRGSVFRVRARLPSCSKTSQLRSVTSAAAGHLSSRGGPSGRRGISRIARCRCALAQSVAPVGCARPPLTVACSTPPSSTRRGSSSPSPTDGARPEPAHACGGAGNQWCCGAGGAAVQGCSGARRKCSTPAAGPSRWVHRTPRPTQHSHR